MKKEVENCLTYLANKLSESYVYSNWTNDIKAQELELGFNTFYDELKKHIDFTKLTIEEAKELRFKRWGDDQPDLWLFPLYLVPIIPEGLEVTFISGEKAKYEKDKMDNDIRFGCVAYGIEIPGSGKKIRKCVHCGKELEEGELAMFTSNGTYCYRDECQKAYLERT